MTTLPEALAQRLQNFFGARVAVHGEDATLKAVEALVEAESARRGEPDPVSGAFHGLALTQGSLIKREYDLSTHGHWEGWDVGALIVDIKHLIRVNMEHGFAAGDAVLRAVATALQETFPSARVVRIHPDAFAVLLPPSAEVAIEASLEPSTREALARRVPALLGAAKAPALTLDYTVAMLHLTVVKPSHWQVLGPLMWAECERALTLASRGMASGVQRRRVELDAAV